MVRDMAMAFGSRAAASTPFLESPNYKRLCHPGMYMQFSEAIDII